MGMAMLTALFVSRIVIDKLGAANYGTYSVIIGAVAILGFANKPLTYSAQRFLTNDKKIDERRRIFSNLLAVHLFIATIVTASAWILARHLCQDFFNLDINSSREIIILTTAAAIALFADIATAPYLALICTKERMHQLAAVQVAEVIMQVAIAATLAFASENRLIIFAIMQSATRLIQRILYIIICKRRYAEARTAPQFNKKVAREMLQTSAWNLAGAAGQTAVVQGLNFMLNIHFGTMVNAARTVAMQVQSTALEFSQNFLQAIAPRLLRKTDSSKSTWQQTKRATASILVVSAIVALPIIIWANEILDLWLVEVPPLTADFVRLILVSMIFESSAEALQTTALAINRLRHFQICTLTGSISTLIFAWMLMNDGAAAQSLFAAQAIIAFILFIIKIFIVKREVNTL